MLITVSTWFMMYLPLRAAKLIVSVKKYVSITTAKNKQNLPGRLSYMCIFPFSLEYSKVKTLKNMIADMQ